MLPQLADGGPGVRFRLFGFPVRVDWTFVLIAVLLGIGDEIDVGRVAVWIGVVGPSILIHELGHAFVARSFGGEPTMTLHGFGGLTSFTPTRDLGRRDQIWLSSAGPLAGLVLGGLAAVTLGVFLDPEPGTLGDFAVRAAIFVNVGWSLVNLLPVLPLDGGIVAENLMRGPPEVRARRAAALSVVVGAAAGVVLLAIGFWFAGFFFGMFAFSNLSRFRQARQVEVARREWEQAAALMTGVRRGDPAALAGIEVLAARTESEVLRRAMKTAVVEMAARGGRVARARELLTTLPGNAPPALYAYLDALDGDPAQAETILLEQLENEPGPDVVRYLSLLRAEQGRAEAVLALFDGLPEDLRSDELLREIHGIADRLGDRSAAAAIARRLV